MKKRFVVESGKVKARGRKNEGQSRADNIRQLRPADSGSDDDGRGVDGGDEVKPKRPRIRLVSNRDEQSRRADILE